MTLIRFRYLKTPRVLSFVVILSLISVLFSITANSFLGFYNGFTNYAGQQTDILAVYSNVGATPFTGTIWLSLINPIVTVDGVLAASPEVIAPVTIEGQSVFVRGVLPDELVKLNSLTMLEGENLTLSDTDSALIGKKLASKLSLKIGDQILAFGVLSSQYVQLTVKGIFESNSALDDEALVPLYVGQWLRGLNYDTVTLIRTKIDPQIVNSNQLTHILSNQTSQPAPTPKSETQRELEALLPLPQANLNLTGKVSVEDSQQFMKSYLDRYGVSKETLLILSVAVLALASGTALCALTLFFKQHSAELETLRALGVSSKNLKLDLVLQLLGWTLVATVIGTLVSAGVMTVFRNLGTLEVLSHALVFEFEPLIVVANFVFLFLLLSLSISRRRFNP
ncbi:MAG: FtsX-like permease family protein [Candidatus Bathyarchaeota archaeon]|nr:FtsX-like permease family protein [Candidatus Bathyarchaeota archaeon]